MSPVAPARWIRAAAVSAADLLWPRRCALCGRPPEPGDVRSGGTFLCPSCRASIAPRDPAACCPSCGKLLLRADRPDNAADAPLCRICRARRPAFDLARSAAEFHGPAGELVHRLKYAGRRDLAGVLADLMRDCFRAQMPGEEPDAVCAVPLHPARLLRRGYNQSDLLARALARRLGLPVAPKLLCRIRDTATQTRMDAKERRENVRDAFSCPTSRAPFAAGRCLLLVDDVMTTGATFDACAAALRAAGAVRILCLSAARD